MDWVSFVYGFFVGWIVMGLLATYLTANPPDSEEEK